MHGSAGDKANYDSAHEEFENARRAANEAYENFVAAKNHLKAAALSAGVEFKDQTGRQFDENVARINEQKKELYESTEQYIRKNPLLSTGFAFLSGLLVSRLLRK